MAFVYANNAVSTLAQGISPTDTTAILATGTGALFPNPSAGQQFALTFRDPTGLINEITYCTARTGDTLTLLRAQEGTTATTWQQGTSAENLITAGTMAAIQNAVPTPARLVQPWDAGLGPYVIKDSGGTPRTPIAYTDQAYNGSLFLPPDGTFYTITGGNITFTDLVDPSLSDSFTLNYDYLT